MTKVSRCIECDLVLLGERVRCPACHARHAEVLASDDDVTVPRPRAVALAPQLLTLRIIAGVLLLVAALGLVLSVKGCA